MLVYNARSMKAYEKVAQAVPLMLVHAVGDNERVAQAVPLFEKLSIFQIPWGHNIVIMKNILKKYTIKVRTSEHMLYKFLLKKILSLFIVLTLCCPITWVYTKKIIMLSPAGHTQHIGRTLSHGYERGQTLKCAEQLQQLLQNNYNIDVILARRPGQEIAPLQIASFANRCNIDFFLSLHFYKETVAKPKMFIYHLVYNPLTDFVKHRWDRFAFIPIHRAHLHNIGTTKTMGVTLKNFLLDTYKKQFTLSGPFGIPVKPLVGITAPALTLEIGLNDDASWQTLLEPLAQGINHLMSNV